MVAIALPYSTIVILIKRYPSVCTLSYTRVYFAARELLRIVAPFLDLPLHDCVALAGRFFQFILSARLNDVSAEKLGSVRYRTEQPWA